MFKIPKKIIYIVVLPVILIASWIILSYIYSVIYGVVKSDSLCKDLNLLTLPELEERLSEARNDCCRCKINNFIEDAKGNGMSRSICDKTCGWY